MTRLSPHCILNLFLVFSCRWALSHSPYTHTHARTHARTHTHTHTLWHSGDYCILSIISEPMICVNLSVIGCSQGLGTARSGGSADPLKFEAEVRLYIWLLWKINVSCYMIKPFDLDLLLSTLSNSGLLLLGHLVELGLWLGSLLKNGSRAPVCSRTDLFPNLCKCIHACGWSVIYSLHASSSAQKSNSYMWTL